jgi:hypothetical protein
MSSRRNGVAKAEARPGGVKNWRCPKLEAFAAESRKSWRPGPWKVLPF